PDFVVSPRIGLRNHYGDVLPIGMYNQLSGADHARQTAVELPRFAAVDCNPPRLQALIAEACNRVKLAGKKRAAIRRPSSLREPDAFLSFARSCAGTSEEYRTSSRTSPPATGISSKVLELVD